MSIFESWTESERRAYLLWGAWREYFLRRQGRFDNQVLDAEKVRSSDQFPDFVAAADWLTKEGREPSSNQAGVRMYVKYVCDYFLSRGFRPTAKHLMQPMLLAKFNQQFSIEASSPTAKCSGYADLADRYRASLHPSLRDSSSFKLLGFDLL